MIFSHGLAALVLDGRKTVTRRRVKSAGEDPRSWLPCLYVEGRTYAVQDRRGGRSLGRIRILSVRHQAMPLLLAGTEALLEGFESPAAFEERWADLHGPDAPRDVWRIEFELITDDGR